MRKLTGTLVGAFLIGAYAVATYTYFHRAAPHHHVITQNLGGNPYTFMEDFAKERRRGDTFEIDGVCFSACSLILGEIPADHVCVTPYARIGFHAAWTEDGEGKRVFAEEATRIIWSVYPKNVREMLQKHGWKGPNVDQQQPIMIEGDELLKLYKPCT